MLTQSQTRRRRPTLRVWMPSDRILAQRSAHLPLREREEFMRIRARILFIALLLWPVYEALSLYFFIGGKYTLHAITLLVLSSLAFGAVAFRFNILFSPGGAGFTARTCLLATVILLAITPFLTLPYSQRDDVIDSSEAFLGVLSLMAVVIPFAILVRWHELYRRLNRAPQKTERGEE